MDKLNLYDVDKDYVKYLQQMETDSRGFTRVPNMDYPGREQKFLCGVVLKVNDINYYVPCSSYKNKKPDNLLIVFKDDKINPIKGSLRFNYMIPVPPELIRVRIIKNEQNPTRRIFLQKQLYFCNDNKDIITRMAERTYKRVTSGYNPYLCQNSCDFKLLEKGCASYFQNLIQIPAPEETLHNSAEKNHERERTPFNDLLVQLTRSEQANEKGIKKTKDNDPER